MLSVQNALYQSFTESLFVNPCAGCDCRAVQDYIQNHAVVLEAGSLHVHPHSGVGKVNRDPVKWIREDSWATLGHWACPDNLKEATVN